jgi:hypothetical protein
MPTFSLKMKNIQVSHEKIYAEISGLEEKEKDKHLLSKMP